ncbi:MAG: hypothetical protein QM811_17985 [Pirellulales bacterium]
MRYHFDLFADYFQFYLQDESSESGLGESWTTEAYHRMLAVSDGIVVIGTVRNMTVPVDVELRDDAPTDSFDGWDQVNECGLDVNSGRIVIAGCTDYFAAAARIVVAPGNYRVRVFYGKLNTLSEDGLAGDDHYRVVLWPGESTSPQVLKQRTTGESG